MAWRRFSASAARSFPSAMPYGASSEYTLQTASHALWKGRSRAGCRPAGLPPAPECSGLCRPLFLIFVRATHEAVFISRDGVSPMQHHGTVAVHAIDQSREHILLIHVRSAPLMLADILDDVPGFLVDQRLMGVLDPYLLGLRTLDLALVLEEPGCAFQVDCPR